MVYELKRIDPLRAANVGALVYGIVTAVFMLIFSPIFLLIALFAPPEEGFGIGMAIAVMLLYPIFGLVFGWLGGMLGAFVYNLVVRWTGGVRLELAGPPTAV